MACVTPDNPAMVNMVTEPTAKANGAFTRVLPPDIVDIQLKIYTPVGTAMNIVDRANADLATGPRPVANMWWAHTPQPMKAMAMPENTMTGYPKSGRRVNTGSTSDTTHMAGRMRMYTSVWQMVQNW